MEYYILQTNKPTNQQTNQQKQTDKNQQKQTNKTNQPTNQQTQTSTKQTNKQMVGYRRACVRPFVCDTLKLINRFSYAFMRFMPVPSAVLCLEWFGPMRLHDDYELRGTRGLIIKPRSGTGTCILQRRVTAYEYLRSIRSLFSAGVQQPVAHLGRYEQPEPVAHHQSPVLFLFQYGLSVFLRPYNSSSQGRITYHTSDINQVSFFW